MIHTFTSKSHTLANSKEAHVIQQFSITCSTERLNFKETHIRHLCSLHVMLIIIIRCMYGNSDMAYACMYMEIVSVK